MHPRWIALPEDWDSIAHRISAVLSQYWDIFPEGAATSLRQIIERVPATGRIDGASMRSAFTALVDASPDSEAAAALTLAVARVLPMTDYDFFATRSGLWQKCAEIAARNPGDYGERSRIFHQDLLYNYYRTALLSAETNAGVDSAMRIVSETPFLSSAGMGRWVAENALLALVRERLREHPAELRQIRAQFPAMMALVRKIDQLLGDQE